MASNKKVGRIVGILLLSIFIIGVTIYQVLQGQVLFKEDFYTIISSHSNKILLSAILGIGSGILSIIVSVLVLPIFKKHNPFLAYLYIVFCVLGFVAITAESITVLSMLEHGQEFVESGNIDKVKVAKTLILYAQHWWAHHIYLITSCFPVFVLFLNLYLGKLVPKVLSGFGMIAAILMFVEILAIMIGNGISDNLMLPIALIQLTFPFWLMAKGLKSQAELEAA
jgi:hypothetical protein